MKLFVPFTESFLLTPSMCLRTKKFSFSFPLSLPLICSLPWISVCFVHLTLFNKAPEVSGIMQRVCANVQKSEH